MRLDLRLEPELGSDLMSKPGSSADVIRIYQSSVSDDLVSVVLRRSREGEEPVLLGVRLSERQVRELRVALGGWLDRNAPEPPEHRACRS